MQRVKINHTAVWIATAAFSIVGVASVKAEVLDAVYRGTLICDKLPFAEAKMREAIEVTIAGEAARYTHVVRLRADGVEANPEQGTGTVGGDTISLQGTWKNDKREYTASYRGNFVRRSAKLSGTQNWNDNGQSFARACSGVIKRPLKIFLPRKKT